MATLSKQMKVIRLLEIYVSNQEIGTAQKYYSLKKIYLSY